MRFWSNDDGTYTIRAWEVTYSDGTPPRLVYTQAIAYREFCGDNGSSMEMKLLRRDRRPTVGTEIPRP